VNNAAQWHTERADDGEQALIQTSFAEWQNTRFQLRVHTAFRMTPGGAAADDGTKVWADCECESVTGALSWSNVGSAGRMRGKARDGWDDAGRGAIETSRDGSRSTLGVPGGLRTASSTESERCAGLHTASGARALPA